jgi:hypothetical protein
LRRLLLSIVLIVVGLAMINGAVVAEFPGAWVPDLLVRTQHWVGAEGAVAGGILGLGLILVAFSSLRYRLWVLLAVVYGALVVALQVDRYFGHQGVVLSAMAFWAAATILMLVLFPTRGRATVGVPAPQQPAVTGSGPPPAWTPPPVDSGPYVPSRSGASGVGPPAPPAPPPAPPAPPGPLGPPGPPGPPRPQS